MLSESPYKGDSNETGFPDDLDRAIAMNEKALACMSDQHPNSAAIRNNLSLALQMRFENTGSMDDLDRAISLNEEAIAEIPEHDPERAVMLSNLGTKLQDRFEQTGHMEDLHRGLEVHEQAAKASVREDPNYLLCLSEFANASEIFFEYTGSIEHLNQAIATYEQVLETSPKDLPDRPVYLSNFGTAIQHRFDNTGSMEDLDRSIATREDALKLMPDDHPDCAGIHNNLGIAFQSRFECTGSMEDLERAIEHKEQAVARVADDHLARSLYLSNLGNALETLFDWTGSMDAIRRAVEIHEEVVLLTADDSPNRTSRLCNLGNALESLFERSKSREHLNRAVDMNEQAVALAPSGNPERCKYLNNLGITLQTLFEETGSIHDLDRAIEMKTLSLSTLPDEHPDRAMYLNNLGISLRSRYLQTGSLNDLDKAISMFEQAAASTPDETPNLSIYLNNLGDLLQTRFEKTNDSNDFEKAVGSMEKAVNVPTGPPLIRISAANATVPLLMGRNISRADCLLRTAVKLLPMMSPRDLKQQDQQYNLSRFAGLTSRAVSVALDAGERPCNALQLLELGRGVIASLLLDVRSDISILKSSNPKVAEEFENLRHTLDSQATKPRVTWSDDQYRSLSKQFDGLLDRIRHMEGFERFLLGPSETEMMMLADNGPIVIFNISDIRSDAFLVETESIQSLRLSSLKHTDLEANTKRFLNAVHMLKVTDYISAKREVSEVLKWLWDVAVRPVLDKLGFVGPPKGDVWPRVWWIGCGLMNILPIHASGYHDSTSLQNAMDRVISSYIPTLKSLAYARQRFSKISTLEKQRALIIGMPKTLEQADLPFVKAEIEKLKELIPAGIETTVLYNPSSATTLSLLQNHQIVHFACHGYSAIDPSQSQILLDDWKIEPLTVSRLTSINFAFPQFAYLSACHTSGQRELNLLDESINLSAAIQLAGFPSVVGTLWQVSDAYAPQVVEIVYSSILQGKKLDTQRSAEGLHRAVRLLRDRTRSVPGLSRKVPNDPLVWATYIHLGV